MANRMLQQAERRPDCITEVRKGRNVLVVSGFLKESGTATASDRMMQVLKTEGCAPDSEKLTEAV